MKWPNKLTGNSFAYWLNALLDSARSCQIKPGNGYRIKSQSADGTVLEILPNGTKQVVYVKVCLDDGSTAYVGMLTTGEIYQNKGTGTTAATVNTTDDIPTGSILLE